MIEMVIIQSADAVGSYTSVDRKCSLLYNIPDESRIETNFVGLVVGV